MDLEQFCSASRVLIVAGKGGVGKTTVTAAIATAATQAGMSVLIVEVEGKSGLAACFAKPALGYVESEMRPGVRARTLTPDEALTEYLRNHGMGRIARRLSGSGALDVVATAVPGMKDILVLGKVKALERGRTADLVIVDAPAAGHAITFLMSARGLLDAVRVGPVRRQARDVVELLTDPTRCRVVLVTVPEATPVRELVETAYALEDRAGTALGPVVVNAFVPALSGVHDARWTDAGVRADAERAHVVIPGAELSALAAASAFRIDLHDRQAAQCEELTEMLPLPQIRLPYLFTAGIGPDEIDVLADAFAAGVESLDPPGTP